MSIPANMDIIPMLDELNSIGWLDTKVMAACGFSASYIAQLRCGNIKDMSYAKAARLYNFYLDEMHKAGRSTPGLQTEAQLSDKSSAPQ